MAATYKDNEFALFDESHKINTLTDGTTDDRRSTLKHIDEDRSWLIHSTMNFNNPSAVINE